MSSILGPSALVWVTDGKTQHPAFLLNKEHLVDDVRLCLVQWTSTKQKEWVESDRVHLELSPRRRQKEESATVLTNPNDNASFAASPEKVLPPCRKRPRTTQHTATKSGDSSSSDMSRDQKPQASKATGSVNKNAKGRASQISHRLTYNESCDAKQQRHRSSGAEHESDSNDNIPLVELIESSVDPTSDFSDDLLLMDLVKEAHSDDDDIEVLFTIGPPSPPLRPRPVSRSPPQPTTNDNDDNDDDNDEDELRNSKSLDKQARSELETAHRSKSHPTELDATFSDTTCQSGKKVLMVEGDSTVFCFSEKSSSCLTFTAENNASLQHSDKVLNTRVTNASSVGVMAKVTLPAKATKDRPEIARLSSSTVEVNDEYPVAENIVERKQYSLRTSAYLQNLCEVCFTVLNDRRWRVGNSLQPLFRWEDGEDLSVVTALSRQFVPRPAPITVKCTCLLCQDEKFAVAETKVVCGNDAKYSVSETARLPSCQGNDDEMNQARAAFVRDEQSPFTTEKFGVSESVSDTEVNGSSWTDKQTNQVAHDSLEVRSLYLYSRLFYRKGPWFRLDDVYKRYYIPKKEALPLQEPDGNNELQGTSTCPRDSMKSEEAPKRSFFESKTYENMGNGTNEKTNSSSIIDKAFLRRHLDEYVPRLLADFQRLESSGMIRFFNDEAECGKTVGMTLLKVEERGVVLSKLGVGTKKPRAARAETIGKNEVWKQMSQQQAIFASQSKDKKASVLPVRRHVDAIILERFVKVIIQACINVDYVPTKVIRENAPTVQSTIQNLIKKLFPAAGARFEGMCFRLREPPTRTLHRCARLYLCATGGPGEMRGSGTNGWKSISDVNLKNPPFEKVISLPGLSTWHQVQYPRLSHCFGLSSACFIQAYKHLSVDDVQHSHTQQLSEQVFFSREAFQCWELCVELRANVDYLIELNELLRYEQRRHARDKEHRRENGKGVSVIGSVDFMSMLSKSGKEAVFGKFGVGIVMSAIRADIDRDIDESLPVLEGECEQVLGTIGIITLHILRVWIKYTPVEEQSMMVGRPWLRHLSCHACLAYLLFDIIPVWERRGLYKLSVQSLKFLLFGSFESSSNASDHLEIRESSALIPSLLSRRARGKAFDRLVIDCGHMHRLYVVEEDKAVKRISSEKFKTQAAQFCQRIVERMAISSSIGFSAIRTMARRLKQPLIDTLNAITCLESKELGLRLSNHDENLDSKVNSKKYSDWTATTDRSIANALKKHESGHEREPGSRCTFVGFEDDDDGQLGSASLNVEELAMELYRIGRMPAVDESMFIRGGWTGWHDEGGHVRALFRILSSAPVLGMDFGCAYHRIGVKEREEQATVHLSPYQQAPFDLHVGYELIKTSAIEGEDTLSPSRGFYFRRSYTIHTFLHKLENSTDQELCDLVYDSIAARLMFMSERKQQDPFLDRDLMQVRTLSAVAAGVGGKQLAAVFRCFYFDYRHYSGGLPDLHLFRAIYDSASNLSSDHLVDLGDWIGEQFSSENQQAVDNRRGAAILIDRDDEFLGCSKVGDSGSKESRSSRNGKLSSNFANSLAQIKIASADMLPERLQLCHNGRKVTVESMMVEVKSSNDRLDARQEDWLNVLDCYGNARVCQFEDKSKSKKKPVTEAGMKPAVTATTQANAI